MHSDATVSSMRRARSVRSSGSEYSTSGACTRSASRMFAPIAFGGVRRDSCPHSIGRSRQSSATKRPRSSRRDVDDLGGEALVSLSLSLPSLSSCSSITSSSSCLSCFTVASASCARARVSLYAHAPASTMRARACALSSARRIFF
eukprot:1267574-Prymnesium_polylepis.2